MTGELGDRVWRARFRLRAGWGPSLGFRCAFACLRRRRWRAHLGRIFLLFFLLCVFFFWLLAIIAIFIAIGRFPVDAGLFGALDVVLSGLGPFVGVFLAPTVGKDTALHRRGLCAGHDGRRERTKMRERSKGHAGPSKSTLARGLRMQGFVLVEEDVSPCPPRPPTPTNDPQRLGGEVLG